MIKKLRIPFAVELSLLYALLGGAWIVFSDRVIASIFIDPAQLTEIQTYKGWLFVVATAILLLALLTSEGKQRKSAEKDLREAETRFRLLVEKLPAAVYTDALDEFSSNLYSSPQIMDITGYTPQEWQSDPELWVKSIHPEDKQRVLEAHRRAPHNHEPFQLEYRMIGRDGRVVWVHDMATLFFDEKKKVQYWQGVLVNITTQKAAADSLHASEARYQTVVEHASDIIFTTDQQWNFLDVNLRGCLLLGYTREELLKISIRDLLTSEELIRQPLRLHELLAGKTVITERTLICKDGSLLPVEFSARALPDGRLLGIARDIRERKLLHESLARSEHRFRSLIENSRDAIALYTTDGRVAYQSPASLQMLGYSDEESSGRNAFEFIHPDDLMLAAEKFQEIIQSPSGSVSVELRCIHKDGSIRWIGIVGSNRVNEPGIEAIVANYRDITEHKQAEVAQATLYQIASAAISTSSLEAFYHSIHQALARVMPAKNFYVALYDPKLDLLNFPYYADEHDHVVSQRRAGKGLTEYVLRTQAPLLASPEIFERLIEAGEVESFGAPSLDWLGVPLIAVGQTIGVMVVQTYEDGIRYSQRDLDLLQFVSTQVAMVIQRKRAEEELLSISKFPAENPNPVLRLAADGKIIYANKASTDLLDSFGLQVNQPVPLDWQEYIGTAMKSGHTEIVEIESLGRTLSCIFSPVQDAGYVNIYASDITEKKHSQTILERQLTELTILHAISLAESSITSVDEIIQRVTQIIGDTLYPENCGILLVNEQGTALKPHPSYRGASKEYQETTLPLNRCVAGKVATSRLAVRIGDVTKEPAYYQVTENVLSELCVPILIGDQIFGVLNVESRALNAFNEQDERFLNTIAGGLATSINRQHLSGMEQLQRQRQAALLDLMRVAASSMDLEQVLDTILGHLLQLIPSQSGTIQLLEGSGLRIAASIGFESSRLALGTVLPLDQFALNAEVIKERRIIRVDDTNQDARFNHMPGAEKVKSILLVPLFFKGKLTGMVTLDSHQPFHFKEQDEELGLAIANHAAIAIENARLFEEEQRRRREAENLREATSALANTIQLESLYEVILDGLSKLIPFDSASIELLDGEYSEIVAERGLPKDRQYVGIRYLAHPQNWYGLEDPHQPGIIPDVRLDERFVKIEGTEYIRGWMSIPLFAQANLIGYINLDSRQVDFYNEEHAALAQTFASQAAITLENALLIREERRRTRIIETLAEIANEISTTGEINALLEKVSQRSLDLLQASHVAIYLVQDDGQTVKVVTACGTYSSELLSHTLRVGEGITGNIIATGKSEIINDTTHDPRRIRVPGTPEEDGSIETMMSSPLSLRGKAIGAINAWRLRSKGLFNQSELNFLISITQQASISIELSHLLHETRRQARESTALAEVGRDVSSTLDLDNVLERIASYAKELLRAETSAVYLHEPETSTLRAIAALGIDAQEIKNDPLKVGEGILGNISIKMTGEIVNDTAADPRSRIVKGTEMNAFEHIMGVPILTKDQLTGLMAVWRTGQGLDFNPGELEFLTSLARQAAVAIENARLFELEQKRRQEAETLQLAATAITSSLEPKQVLETILTALQQVIPYDSAAMMLIENNHVRIVAGNGFPKDKLVIGRTFPSSNALLEEVNRSGRALVLDDAQEDPRYEKWANASSVRGWMGVPLIARGNIIGYFTIDSKKVGTFNANSAAVVQTFAHQASAAIENARLYNETRQRLEEQEIISRVSVALRSAQGSDEMLPILLDEIMASIGSNTCAIWLWDEGKQEIVQKIASGWLANLPKSSFKPKEGIVGQVYATGKVRLSEELLNDPDLHPENREFYRSGWGGITIPIQTRTNVIGVLAVELPQPRHIEPNHVRLLTTIAEIAGNAIHRVNLFQRSEEQVRHLMALREVDTAIASSFDLNVTLSLLANHIVMQMGADAVSFFKLQPNQLALEFLSGVGFSTNTISEMTMQVGEGVAGRAVLNRNDVYIEDLSREKSFKRRKLLAEDRFTSYYAVPMISKGQPQGVLEVFFREPFTPQPEWIDFIETLAGQATIAIDNARLFEDLQRSNQELSLAYDTTLEGWGKALELRDKETQGHTRRVTDLTLKLARRLGVPEANLIHIHRGVLLHDIGKMGVADQILRKEGPLTPEERVIMENHPVYAYELLSTISYLRPALDIPYCHHEWWDGSGYPRKLKGEQIPLSARIFAVVDVWDALLSNRPYRRAWSKQKAIAYLHEHSGTQFDPDILEVFLKLVEHKKRRKYPD